jgi:hypothetical protein
MRLDAGAILSWKYKNAEGISTVDGKITAWPDSLGTKPTNQQINAMGVEYDAYVLAQKNAEAAKAAAKAQALVDGLPTWAKLKNKIDEAFPDPLQNALLTKVFRAFYWVAKDSQE